MSEHPVDDLDQSEFDLAAGLMAAQIGRTGFGYIELCPGDATSYKILMGRTPTATPQHTLLFASSFGPLYPWSPANSDFTSWDYCLDHFLMTDARSGEWTARVFSRFLNTLRPLLMGRPVIRIENTTATVKTLDATIPLQHAVFAVNHDQPDAKLLVAMFRFEEDAESYTHDYNYEGP